MSATITTTDGQAVMLRHSARARRIVLRVPRDGRVPVLTLPSGVAVAQGRAFLEARADWLRQAVDRVPAPMIVVPGAVLPVEGRALHVTPVSRRGVAVMQDQLLVPVARPVGPAVQAFLKLTAQQRLSVACDRHAGALGRSYRMLALRDTRSRWGSCTHDGRLMFSWRLAMAPPEVLDYVAAHEVAHLAHLDHSARFWSAVARLMPGYKMHRDWLRVQGGDLLAWQFTATADA